MQASSEQSIQIWESSKMSLGNFFSQILDPIIHVAEAIPGVGNKIKTAKSTLGNITGAVSDVASSRADDVQKGDLGDNSRLQNSNIMTGLSTGNEMGNSADIQEQKEGNSAQNYEDIINKSEEIRKYLK